MISLHASYQKISEGTCACKITLLVNLVSRVPMTEAMHICKIVTCYPYRKECDRSSFVVTPLQPSRQLDCFRYTSSNNLSQFAPGETVSTGAKLSCPVWKDWYSVHFPCESWFRSPAKSYPKSRISTTNWLAECPNSVSEWGIVTLPTA